eukprot:TRINITY_DN1340_c0_g3_i1.p1 TRINITY_DN1340_c0_g3~~TRINITY_DN1340_c0_g3_i1.p1  ORF type:complete len:104 (+),score=11.12 TRINITY_DN1340_c0_g3_i1:279-590(+)
MSSSSASSSHPFRTISYVLSKRPSRFWPYFSDNKMFLQQQQQYVNIALGKAVSFWKAACAMIVQENVRRRMRVLDFVGTCHDGHHLGDGGCDCLIQALLDFYG